MPDGPPTTAIIKGRARFPARGAPVSGRKGDTCDGTSENRVRPAPAKMTVGAAMAVETAHPPPLLVILGATASGKSALAMAVARRRTGAEILRAGAMQVYRGRDVGTAKPTPIERREVPHHLLDLVGPDETFVVARFVE